MGSHEAFHAIKARVLRKVAEKMEARKKRFQLSVKEVVGDTEPSSPRILDFVGVWPVSNLDTGELAKNCDGFGAFRGRFNTDSKHV